MTCDLVTLLSGRTRPVSGSARARRVALLARYGGPRFEMILTTVALWIVAALVFRVTDDLLVTGYAAFFSLVLVAPFFNADRLQGSEDYAWTLPVSREEAFRWRYWPALFLMMTVPAVAWIALRSGLSAALWSLIAEGPLAEPGRPWGAMRTVVLFGVCAITHAVCFLFSTLRLNVRLLMAIAIVCIPAGVVPIMFLLGNADEFERHAPFAAAGFAFVFAVLTIITRRCFLNTEVLPSADAPKATIGFAKKDIAEPVPPRRVSVAPAVFSSCPAGIVAGAKARRAALVAHTYGGHGMLLGWSLGLAVVSGALIRGAGYGQALVAIGVLSYVRTGWKTDTGPEEYALSLPVSRGELFRARATLPVLVLLALGAWNALAGGVFDIPGALWGFEDAPTPTLIALTALLPAVATIVVIVLPMAAPRSLFLIYFLCIGNQFLLPRPDDFSVAEIVVILVVFGALAWGYAKSAFATKEVLPIFSRTQGWGR